MLSGGFDQQARVYPLRFETIEFNDKVQRRRTNSKADRLWFYFRKRVRTAQNCTISIIKTITPEYMPPELLIMLESGSS